MMGLEGIVSKLLGSPYPFRPLARLAQDEEPGCACSEGGEGGLGTMSQQTGKRKPGERPPAPRPNSGLTTRQHIWGATPCIKDVQARGLDPGHSIRRTELGSGPFSCASTQRFRVRKSEGEPTPSPVDVIVTTLPLLEVLSPGLRVSFLFRRVGYRTDRLRALG